MTTMRLIRTIATALLASLAVAGCGRSQPRRERLASQPAAGRHRAPCHQGPNPRRHDQSPPVVLVDGRHPVFLKTVDPAGR